MGTISAKRAATINELNAAAWVRSSVFADELGYLDPDNLPAGCEVDGYDLLPTTVNFLAFVNGEPAGTVRLLFPNTSVAARCGTRFGLSIERTLKLQQLKADVAPAEISRLAVLGRYRRTSVVGQLFGAAYQESVRRGSTHWVGVANTETDCEADARIVRQLLEAYGFWLPEYEAAYRKDQQQTVKSRYPLFTEVHRDQVAQGKIADVILPRTLKLFATKLGVRYYGLPYFDEGFRIFAIPLILRLSDFAMAPGGSGRATTQPHAGQRFGPTSKRRERNWRQALEAQANIDQVEQQAVAA